jgi:tetratricopeptide (TPR) repeat protein
MQLKDRYRFLIVTDKALIAQLLATALKKNDIRNYEHVRNGEEALKRIRVGAFNFLVTDWNMPKISGIELVKILRNDPNTFDIPILMVSAESAEGKVLYAVEEGVDGYQEKPFTEESLMNKINEIILSKMNPDPMKYKIQKLFSMKAQKKYMEAIVFGKSLLNENQNTGVYMLLSQCYLEKKEYNEAKKCLTDLLEIENNSKALHLLGKIYLEEGNFKEALHYFEESYVLNPMNHNVVIDIGQVYLKMGSFKEAAETFGTLNDDFLSNIDIANIGAAYLGTGDVEKAGKYFNQAGSPILETVAVFNKYAMELRKIGDFEGAVKHYKKCLRVDPRNYALLYNIAIAYCEMKEYREAEKLLEECIRIEPRFRDGRKFLDYVKSKMRDHEAASRGT